MFQLLCLHAISAACFLVLLQPMSETFPCNLNPQDSESAVSSRCFHVSKETIQKESAARNPTILPFLLESYQRFSLFGQISKRRASVPRLNREVPSVFAFADECAGRNRCRSIQKVPACIWGARSPSCPPGSRGMPGMCFVYAACQGRLDETSPTGVHFSQGPLGVIFRRGSGSSDFPWLKELTWVWVKIKPPGIGPQVLAHVSIF